VRSSQHSSRTSWAGRRLGDLVHEVFHTVIDVLGGSVEPAWPTRVHAPPHLDGPGLGNLRAGSPKLAF
jgi:hypothetical protein